VFGLCHSEPDPGSVIGGGIHIAPARNLVMDLEDTGCQVKYLIRDRDGKYPALFDQVLAGTGIDVVLSGVRVPRMNSIMERWRLNSTDRVSGTRTTHGRAGDPRGARASGEAVPCEGSGFRCPRRRSANRLFR
jgi:hypothetical protein